MNTAGKYYAKLHVEVGSMGLDCFRDSLGLGLGITCSHWTRMRPSPPVQ